MRLIDGDKDEPRQISFQEHITKIYSTYIATHMYTNANTHLDTLDNTLPAGPHGQNHHSQLWKNREVPNYKQTTKCTP